MPFAARAIAVCFGIAALLALVAIPISWFLIRADSGAGLISAEGASTRRALLLVLGCVLVSIYAGAAWTIWTGRNWAAAMLLSVCALFAFPVGTVLSVAAIIVLSRKGMRAAFHTRAIGGN